MVVGVLALQGDFAEHLDVLHDLGVDAREVRTVEDLSSVERLIIPGGESTVMSELLRRTGLDKAILRRTRSQNLPLFGTCAGAILLATEVSGKSPPKTLGLLDITIERNAYGTQLQSFEKKIRVKGIRSPVPVAFIRAPKITRVGKNVHTLSLDEGNPILVRQGSILAGTFHPEVSRSAEVHQFFLEVR